MATEAEVEEALYKELATSRGSTPDSVREDIGAGGEIDSLEGVELIAAVEERFGVHISDRELTANVCSAIPLLARLVTAKTATADRKKA